MKSFSMVLIEKLWIVTLMILVSYGFIDSKSTGGKSDGPLQATLAITSPVTSTTLPSSTAEAATSDGPSTADDLQLTAGSNSSNGLSPAMALPTPPVTKPSNGLSPAMDLSTPPVTKPSNGSSPAPALPTPPVAKPSNGSSPATALPTPPVAKPSNGSSPATALPTPPVAKPSNGSSPATALPTPPVAKPSNGSSPAATLPTPPVAKPSNVPSPAPAVSTPAVAEPSKGLSKPFTNIRNDDEKEDVEVNTHTDGNGPNSPMDFLTYFIVVVVMLVICYLFYSNRARLKTLYNNHRNICCAKWSKGVTYKRVPVILEEHDLKDYKNYVY